MINREPETLEIITKVVPLFEVKSQKLVAHYLYELAHKNEDNFPQFVLGVQKLLETAA